MGNGADGQAANQRLGASAWPPFPVASDGPDIWFDMTPPISIEYGSLIEERSFHHET